MTNSINYLTLIYISLKNLASTMGSLSKPRADKHCNYCKNHDIEVLEKGHREECKNKSCPCDLCRKTRRKALNTKRWRERNASKNIAGNRSIRKVTTNATFKKGIHEYLAFKSGK